MTSDSLYPKSALLDAEKNEPFVSNVNNQSLSANHTVGEGKKKKRKREKCGCQ